MKTKRKARANHHARPTEQEANETDQEKVLTNPSLKHTCTGRQQSFTPGGEPPLVPVPHPGASIRD